MKIAYIFFFSLLAMLSTTHAGEIVLGISGNEPFYHKDSRIINNARTAKTSTAPEEATRYMGYIEWYFSSETHFQYGIGVSSFDIEQAFSDGDHIQYSTTAIGLPLRFEYKFKSLNNLRFFSKLFFGLGEISYTLAKNKDEKSIFAALFSPEAGIRYVFNFGGIIGFSIAGMYGQGALPYGHGFGISETRTYEAGLLVQFGYSWD